MMETKTTASKEQIRLYYSFRSEERNTAIVYRAIAARTTDVSMSAVFEQMAITEEKHASRWENLLEKNGIVLKPFKPSGRTYVFLTLIKLFGANSIIPILVNLEKKGAGGYVNVSEAEGMEGQERAHALILEQLSQTQDQSHGNHIGHIEGRHRTPGGNALRAAVMGASDGLLSNFNLTMGVAGATVGAAAGNKFILLTGLAGLLAGAISMAIGEWISVKSSEELYQHQYETEKAEIENAPEEEMEELVLIYQARGHSQEQARALAEHLFQNIDKAAEVLVAEEAGSDAIVEEGSAWEAALTSFCLFAIGAIIPVAPYFFLTGIHAIGLSIAFSILGLFTLGAVITIFTGKTIWYSGIRQVIIGCLAAGATFAVGHFIGVSLS
jgi:VIT1/CCC1 family predicted Fe2+/Mn2+ transporter